MVIYITLFFSSTEDPNEFKSKMKVRWLSLLSTVEPVTSKTKIETLLEIGKNNVNMDIDNILCDLLIKVLNIHLLTLKIVALM